MYWTLELASKLEDAPWPATKEELLDYATRSGAPLEVLEKMKVMFTRVSRTSGLIILQRMTSYGMTTNIKKSMIGLFSYQGAAFFIFLMSLFRLYLINI